MACEDPGDDIETGWELIGDTYAVSEAQAINNVRYRNDLPSNFSILDSRGHWEKYIEYKAEIAVTKDYNYYRKKAIYK